MKWLRNKLFYVLLFAVLVCNEFVLAYLFAHSGEVTGIAKWVVRGVGALLLLGVIVSPWISGAISSRIVAMFRRAPSFSSALLGVGLAGALAVAIELSFYAYLVIEERNNPEPIIVRDVPLAEIMSPGVTCREQRLDGEKVIYDFVYTLDEHSARVTPASPVEATGRDLVFFGCSFTFGVGLSDDEAMPNRVAQRATGWRVTNFGGGGYGPAHMLRRIEDGQTTELFRGNDTRVVYTYIPHHVRRVIGGMRTATRFCRDAPYYALTPDGELEYRGTMTTGRPWLQPFYEALDHEAVLKYFGVDIPIQITDRHLDFTARIIAASRDRWAEALDESDFTVVIYPQPLWAETASEDIIPMLKARGIRCLDYSHRFDGQPEMWIPGDKHPTARAQDRVAQWIVQDLALARTASTTD